MMAMKRMRTRHSGDINRLPLAYNYEHCTISEKNLQIPLSENYCKTTAMLVIPLYHEPFESKPITVFSKEPSLLSWSSI